MQAGEKVGKSRNTVFLICGSGRSKSRLAKAAGAEPSGQMRDEKCTKCPSQNVQSTPARDHFWKLRCRKSLCCCGASTFRSQKTNNWRALSTFGRSDVVLRVSGLCTLPKVSETWRFCSSFKTMAGVGHLKRICKDACRVADAVQKTHELDVLGDQGANFLWGVAFSVLDVLGRWFCVTGAALRMAWHHFVVAGAVL